MDVDIPATGRSAPQSLTDNELLLKDLPQLSVPCVAITISSKHVLKKAAKKLGVSIHGYKFTSLGDEEVLASVTMDVPPHKGNPTMKSQEFHGNFCMFSSEAKESACHAALAYLENAGLIAVHDINFAQLKIYKRKFETEQFWSSALYDRASALKRQLLVQGNAMLPAGQPNTNANAPAMDSSTGENKSTPPSTTAEAFSSMKEQPLSQSHVRRSLFPAK